MAWVLPDAEASRKLVSEHRSACEAFSLVTLAFNLFFLLAWVCYFFKIDFLGWLLLLAILAFFVFGRAHELLAPAFVLIASCVLGLRLWSIGAIPHLPPPVKAIATTDLACLAPVCLFGFALCPYLDLTFHHARQSNGPTAGRVAFAVGFGVFFLAAILFTLAYSGWVVYPGVFIIPLAFAAPLAFYLSIQLLLKVAMHLHAIKPSMRARTILLSGSAIIVLASWCNAHNAFDNFSGISTGEQIYLCFLSFYGLVFPAYVWICIFGKRSRFIWLAAVLITSPMYWMGFIERQMFWLLPGVAIVFAARFLPPTMKARTAP
jgi:hypothetical protein